MGAIFTMLTKGLSNPKVQRVLLIIVLILVVMYLLNKSNQKFKVWFQSTFKGVQGDSVYAPISDPRKTQLEQMAEDLHAGIWGNEWNSVLANMMSNMNALPDNELTYIAQYYGNFLSPNTMHYDIDWEIMPFEDADDQLLARLSAMNLQGTNTGYF